MSLGHSEFGMLFQHPSEMLASIECIDRYAIFYPTCALKFK